MNTFFRVFSRVHTYLLERTGGRSFTMGGRVLVLRSTGAKSGQRRSNPLMFLEEGDGWILAASAAGADRHPGWFHNLRKTPDAEIFLRGDTIPVRASIPEGEERDRLWARFVAAEPRFADYQRKTTRRIPVIVLNRR